VRGLLVAADAAGAARLAAEALVRRGRGAVAARGRFILALAGGSTPRRLHGLLSDPAGPFAGALDWSRVVVLLGDERCVPPGHPGSNFRMARETLLSRLPIPARNVLRPRGEDPDPERAARDYEGALRALFPAGTPAVDLVLLGMGPDGHVASLFPGSPALDERRRWVAAPFVPVLGAHRLTLTLPVVEAAGSVLLLATGRDKAARLAEALSGPGALPAQRIRPRSGDLVVALDAAAARLLRSPAPAGQAPGGSRLRD
jgi:6-phosphogluconolactonase